MIGADINATDEVTGNSALLLAASKGRMDVESNIMSSKIHSKLIASNCHRPRSNGEEVN